MGTVVRQLLNSNMFSKALLLSMVAFANAAPQATHNLPVLFSFSQPGHNVAVFRGADLKKAIAAGLVTGLKGSGDDGAAAAKAAADARDAAAAKAAADAQAAAEARAAAAARAAAYKPAPIIYKPAPVVYKSAPAPVVYKPAATTVYKAAPSYVEPSYADIPAKYDWEYAVKDDYTNNDFGAKESRDGYLTNGKYYVALPDGRLQTVTYVVDGGAGYVPVVEYVGEAQYPPEAPATYTL